MVRRVGTIAQRLFVGSLASLLLASAGGAQVQGTTPSPAALPPPGAAAPKAPSEAWWTLLEIASMTQVVESLRFRPPALRAAMLAEALAATEVRTDAMLRDRVLQAAAAFPEQASALVADFLAAEPPIKVRDRTPRRASKGALAFLGAVCERTSAADAARLQQWLKGQLGEARWSDPADRPALQLWAQLAIAAVVRDASLAPDECHRRLGRDVDATETGWALADALVHHPIGRDVAVWVADAQRQDELLARRPLWLDVAKHLNARRLGAGLASSRAARAHLISRRIPEDLLAPYGTVLQLLDADPAVREQARQSLLRDPPTETEFANLVVQAAGSAGVDLQREVLAWLSRGTVEPGLGSARTWEPTTWEAFVQRVGAGKTIREHLLAGPPEGTLLAIGVDLGIERLLDELSRLDAKRRDLLADPALVASFPSLGRDARALQESLWGDRSWFDDKGGPIFDLHDDAAVDRALRELPAVPSGSVLRLVRVAIDHRQGELSLARACVRHVLSTKWDEVRPESSQKGPTRRAALRMPRVVLGSPEVWQQLTAVAASIPHREDGGPAWYKANTILAAHFVLASQQVGLITWPEPPESANPPGPGPIENRDPLLEFWVRRWHYLDAPPKAPPRWFAGVELHRRDIDGLPAIEYTLRPAEPAPR